MRAFWSQAAEKDYLIFFSNFFQVGLLGAEMAIDLGDRIIVGLLHLFLVALEIILW